VLCLSKKKKRSSMNTCGVLSMIITNKNKIALEVERKFQQWMFKISVCTRAGISPGEVVNWSCRAGIKE